ncbi:hypothetical protein MLD38_000579 [Melastoma candidum]|uniref:Uncharacterized protein n=1 Tax=Melastoma candidum TaxID=119954 RepID=A0ACB9SBT6_9MYRT|nr:hypothetical protein MLD38_000579 [Melastoma candidum]
MLPYFNDRNVVAQLVRKAERAGFKAIALTVDNPRLGRREAEIKNRFALPPFFTVKNFEVLDLGKTDKVVKAAQRRVPVFLDQGVRHGTDVFKALSPRSLRDIRDFFRLGYFELTMALSGCRSLKEKTCDHVTIPWDHPLPSLISPRLRMLFPRRQTGESQKMGGPPYAK